MKRLKQICRMTLQVIDIIYSTINIVFPLYVLWLAYRAFHNASYIVGYVFVLFSIAVLQLSCIRYQTNRIHKMLAWRNRNETE